VKSGVAILFFAAVAAAAPGDAATPAGAPVTKAASPPAAETTGAPVTVTVAPVTVSPGGRTEATVTLEIARGYRLIAPGTRSAWAQPPILSFDAADGVFAEAPAWPAGKAWRSDPGEPEVQVYEGTLDLKVVVHAQPQAAPRTTSLAGRLRYQPIRGDFFMKVAILPVRMPVELGASKAAAKPAAPPAATRP
jgi:hypothetical protein